MNLSSFLEFISGILIDKPYIRGWKGLIPIGTHVIRTAKNPSPEVLRYVKFLETSGIQDYILSKIRIPHPVLLQGVWPDKMGLVPIWEDGKIAWMLRGDERSYSSCRFFRLQIPEVPKVDFVPYDRAVNCIIRSDIKWPLTPYKPTLEELIKGGEEGGLIYRVIEAGFYPSRGWDEILRYKDAAEKEWIFLPFPGQRTSTRNIPEPNQTIERVMYFTERNLPLPPRSEDYPYEYKLPEIDPNYINMSDLKLLLSKYAKENVLFKYSNSLIEVIVSLLAMKLYIGDKEPEEVFGDNLHIFGYLRTPLFDYYPYGSYSPLSLLKNPSILYEYQAKRDEAEEIGYIDSIGKVNPMPVPFKHIEIPVRSWGLTRKQVAEQLTRNPQRLISRKEVEEINPYLRDRRGSQVELKEAIDFESRSIADKGLYPIRWKEGVDWPTYKEDKRQILINGVTFTIGELEYVFHNTVIENVLEAEELKLEVFAPGQMEIIQSFLDGKLAPEEFYRSLDDIAFGQLSSKGSYLDYYEKLTNRREINLAYVLYQPFVTLLQRIQKDFFAGEEVVIE